MLPENLGLLSVLFALAAPKLQGSIHQTVGLRSHWQQKRCGRGRQKYATFHWCLRREIYWRTIRNKNGSDKVDN